MGWLGLDVGVSGAKRLTIAVVTSFGLLLVAGAAAFVLANQAARAERLVAHTLEVRRVNQALFAKVQDATLGERGFLITEDERYLAQFERAKGDVPLLLARLRDLTRDNPAAGPRLDNFERGIRAQLAELDRTVGLLQGGRRDEAVAAVRSHLIVNHLEDVRAANMAIEAAEVTLLVGRDRQVAANRALLVGAMAT